MIYGDVFSGLISNKEITAGHLTWELRNMDNQKSVHYHGGSSVDPSDGYAGLCQPVSPLLAMGKLVVCWQAINPSYPLITRPALADLMYLPFSTTCWPLRKTCLIPSGFSAG